MKKEIGHLTKIQHYVTQECGTENPYDNEFNDFFETGVYVDIVSGEPLFSSQHKFQAGCGWPAFYRSLVPENIVRLEDNSLGRSRVEVRSKEADSHLGHVFTDGPAPTGIRYCINSAALRFIAVADLEEEGLGEFTKFFKAEQEKDISEASAIFGAGCFWGVEAIFAKTVGVLDAVSGYMGGESTDPTYIDICTGKSGHAEVVKITYNQNEISYEELTELFFKMHDPTTLNRQGADRGTQYRSAIFYLTDEQKEAAFKVITRLNTDIYDGGIVTEVTSAPKFYMAEEFHQDYYDKKYQGGSGPICHYVRGV